MVALILLRVPLDAVRGKPWGRRRRQEWRRWRWSWKEIAAMLRLFVDKSVEINAPATMVWRALTNPVLMVFTGAHPLSMLVILFLLINIV